MDGFKGHHCHWFYIKTLASLSHYLGIWNMDGFKGHHWFYIKTLSLFKSLLRYLRLIRKLLINVG